ncbi:MAG: hypothetical protein P9L94_18140 [Candidatus Hinthialibacter antarcticus]|nr:hypothetical protein [Candidatus Hinthialibacter antarcticus]
MIALKKPAPSLTSDQRRIEQQAIDLLTRAQRMLLKGDGYTHEAQKLRDHVMCDLLPSNRMYIKGSHPSSLLRDVDRRLLHARMRLVKSGAAYSSAKKKEQAKASLDEHKFVLQQRYKSARSSHEQQMKSALGWLTVLAFAAVLGMVAYHHYYGFSSLHQSFQWIPPR